MKKFHLAGFFIASLIISGGVSSFAKNNQQENSENKKLVFFETTVGDFAVEVFEDVAPLHSEAFLERVSEGYYDGVPIYLIGSSEFAQAGRLDSVQKKYEGEFIPDEIGLSNKKGTLTFANAGIPDSNVPELVFNLEDNFYFDKYQSVFAQVVEGEIVLDEIARQKVDGDLRPVQSIFINKAYLDNIE